MGDGEGDRADWSTGRGIGHLNQSSLGKRLIVKNAYECREHYAPNGRCIKREKTFGPIVVWGVVVIALLAAGRQIPPSSWQLVKFW